MSIVVKRSHDRQAVELLTDNDLINLSVSETEILIARLKAELKKAKFDTQEAPSPLDWSAIYTLDKNDISKEWANCGVVRKGQDVFVDIAGYELDLKQMKELRKWISDWFHYFNEVNK